MGIRKKTVSNAAIGDLEPADTEMQKACYTTAAERGMGVFFYTAGERGGGCWFFLTISDFKNHIHISSFFTHNICE